MTTAINTRYDAASRHNGPVIITDDAGEIALTAEAFGTGDAQSETFEAPGVDSNGTEWRVMWTFDEAHEDPSDHNWDDVSCIEVRAI